MNCDRVRLRARLANHRTTSREDATCPRAARDFDLDCQPFAHLAATGQLEKRAGDAHVQDEPVVPHRFVEAARARRPCDVGSQRSPNVDDTGDHDGRYSKLQGDPFGRAGDRSKP